MQHDIVVFTGPTLSPETARQHLDALYLPPADQGAIAYVVSEVKPAVIVLIDGVFGHVPAIRHKEILWALSKNVCMCGAASMGAIRAAELHSEGMQGYGLIYRWYRATPLADDDEVAVAMSPVEMGSRPIGEALINIRLTLRLAVRPSRLTLWTAAIRKLWRTLGLYFQLPVARCSSAWNDGCLLMLLIKRKMMLLGFSIWLPLGLTRHGRRASARLASPSLGLKISKYLDLTPA
jgi:hypothetical protein